MTVTMLDGRLFVGGEWVGSSASERTFEVLNPANGEVLTTLPDGGKEEMHRAIDTAAEAQGKWGETTAQYRAGITREGEDPGSSRPLLAQRERLHRVAKGCQHVSISARCLAGSLSASQQGGSNSSLPCASQSLCPEAVSQCATGHGPNGAHKLKC
jgi:hypothetical protein